VNEAARGHRRAQARRRAQIQRRRIVALSCAGALLLILVLALASLGGDEGRAGDGGSGVAPKPPPELPRGGRSIFPEFRVVAFAGAPQAEALGALGIGTLEEAARRLERQAAPYARGRGRRPILPAFELIAVIANATPRDDGKYRTRQRPEVVREHLEAARRARALLLLDVQPGRADFMEEVQRLDPFLAQPDVGLALDPEWHMGEGGVPGQAIGSVTAEEVNEVSAHLSGIVARGRLPEKLLIVHQFTGDMIEDRRALRHYPGVALTLNVDGFGDQRLKIDKYDDFARKRDRAHHGFKLFYTEDTGLMTPTDVLRLRPEPEFVVYE
jgi:hypothetical protein